MWEKCAIGTVRIGSETAFVDLKFVAHQINCDLGGRRQTLIP